MSILEFIQFARAEGLMTITKPYGIVAGEYTLVFENHKGITYPTPKLYKGNDLQSKV